jgi:hypothetical protein
MVEQLCACASRAAVLVYAGAVYVEDVRTVSRKFRPRVLHGSIVPTDSLFQQFAEFLHLASAAICEEAGAGLVPPFEMAKANPI